MDRYIVERMRRAGEALKEKKTLKGDIDSPLDLVAPTLAIKKLLHRWPKHEKVARMLREMLGHNGALLLELFRQAPPSGGEIVVGGRKEGVSYYEYVFTGWGPVVRTYTFAEPRQRRPKKDQSADEGSEVLISVEELLLHTDHPYALYGEITLSAQEVANRILKDQRDASS